MDPDETPFQAHLRKISRDALVKPQENLFAFCLVQSRNNETPHYRTRPIAENDEIRFPAIRRQMPTEEQTNVVVVEDDVGVRESILRLLDAAGFRAMAFASAEALLKAMVVSTAGCLVVDIALPGLSGFELYQRLLESDSKLPVIFITEDDGSSGARRAHKLGAVAYLSKPVPEQDLLDAITRALIGQSTGLP
jgi:CheY-like chemotaxis protein